MTLYKQIPAHAERGQTVTYEEATPAEISAAHPKCETCKHWDRCSHIERNHPQGMCGLHRHLTNENHYCPYHTELKGGTP